MAQSRRSDPARSELWDIGKSSRQKLPCPTAPHFNSARTTAGVHLRAAEYGSASQTPVAISKVGSDCCVCKLVLVTGVNCPIVLNSWRERSGDAKLGFPNRGRHGKARHGTVPAAIYSQVPGVCAFLVASTESPDGKAGAIFEQAVNSKLRAGHRTGSAAWSK